VSRRARSGPGRGGPPRLSGFFFSRGRGLIGYSTPAAGDKPAGGDSVLPENGNAPATGVFVGLGSNLGAREELLRDAVRALAALPRTGVVRCSSIYESEPWGGAAQPAYLNMVVELATSLEPASLLDSCLAIERSLGRERRMRWESRPIDLDLILWGDRVEDGSGLSLPHPLFRDRRFVLAPLAEIAPGAVDPVSGRTARELLAACSDGGAVSPRRAG
jgi:2-amino-4-hydroxy-6-hydroxymethyldihydropteridine diphosphokinase